MIEITKEGSELAAWYANIERIPGHGAAPWQPNEAFITGNATFRALARCASELVVMKKDMEEIWRINAGGFDNAQQKTIDIASNYVSSPEIDPDVLVVRAILHAHQRSMSPPDSGWGDMSYIKGSYDYLPDFQKALAAYKNHLKEATQ